jgi:hypothetical protein
VGAPTASGAKKSLAGRMLRNVSAVAHEVL